MSALTPEALAAPRAAGTCASATPAATRPAISVVIVNYCQWINTSQLAWQLAESDVSRSNSAETIVIDNNSPAHPRADLLRRQEGVSIRRFSTNRGFARAVNEGCRRGSADWVLILNPDISVDPGFLDRAVALADGLLADDPAAGVIGFRLRHADGSPQGSCGPYPTLAGTLGGVLTGRPRRKCWPEPPAVPCRVPWVTGCCLLVRRDCFEQLGGFDERFFLYYEDVDFCLRAREAGWGVWHEPRLEVTHHSPLHTREVPAALRLITRHALVTFGAKHWPGWQRRLLGGLVWLEATARRRWAWLRGRPEAAAFHGELCRLVGDWAGGRDHAVRRRIRRAADALQDLALALDGHSC